MAVLVAFVAVVAIVAVAAFPPIFKLATGVVEVTISGGVPVATVEVNDLVTLRLVPVAAPITGVTRVGEVSITNLEPVPVCKATEVAFPILVIGPVKFALVVTLPVVNPAAVPVIFVPTRAEGVPKAGVTKVGEVDNTVLPVPVAVVTPVPPFATGKVPVTPVVKGNPVRFVATPEVGVPSAGAVSVGLFKVLLAKVSAPANVANVPVVGSVTAVAAVEVNVVAYAPDVVRLPPSVIVFPVLAIPVPPLAPGNVPVTPVANGNPVRLVATPEVGVPRIGVTKVGEVDNTVLPVPVEVVTPVPPLATASVALRPAAFPPIFKLATGVVEVTIRGAVPVGTFEVNDPVSLRLVPVAPRINGVTRIGELDKTVFPVPVEVVTPVPPLTTGNTPVITPEITTSLSIELEAGGKTSP